ncbi:hypothetical protein BH10ACT3_BH10ACT3_09770 [soil metagenome]
MKKSTSKLLNKDERDLVRATDAKRLAKLDTDQLVELHTRVRRARNKYLKLHRRQAGAQVDADRARGVAATKNQRTAVKAEVFEEALSAVSSQLASASKKSAAKLRKDRLKAARPSPKKGAAKKGAVGNRAARRKIRPATRYSSRTRNSSKRKGDQSLKSPARRKAAASSRASNKRRQAAKNNR